MSTYITDYEVVDLGMDNSQYFQGFGTSHTDYAYAVTGIGDTYNEALADALEMVAQSHTSLDNPEYLDEIEESEKLDEKANERTSAGAEQRLQVSNEIGVGDYIDNDCDHEEGDFCEECHEATVDSILEDSEVDFQYYVGIRYNIAEEDTDNE